MKLQSSTRRLITTLALLGLGVAPTAQAIEEGELKAAIIFNILLFVDWPSDAQPESGGPLGFCVGADSSLYGPLKALNDRPIRGYRSKCATRSRPPDPAVQADRYLRGDHAAGHARRVRGRLPAGAAHSTRDRRDQSRLDYLAYFDPVTGLPNRHAANEQIQSLTRATSTCTWR